MARRRDVELNDVETWNGTTLRRGNFPSSKTHPLLLPSLQDPVAGFALSPLPRVDLKNTAPSGLSTQFLRFVSGPLPSPSVFSPILPVDLYRQLNHHVLAQQLWHRQGQRV